MTAEDSTACQNLREVYRRGAATPFGRGLPRWHANNSTGDVFRVEHPVVASRRIGDCWMRGRLKKGDLVLCVDHTGDGFHDYILLEVGMNFIKAVSGSRFGAYGMAGSQKITKLEEADFLELLSKSDNSLIAPFSFRSVQEAQRGEHLQKLVKSLHPK